MPMNARLVPVLALCLAALVACPATALAAGWAGKDGGASSRQAGYFLDDALPALMFRCAGPGRLAMTVAGGSGLPRDADYTVVVLVDDVAFVEVTRAGSAATADPHLVRVAAVDSFAPLIDALKNGKGAEIATPRGRYRLPLRGSGKALAVLDGGCGV